MKARDIIPGWPKCRSTINFVDYWRLEFSTLMSYPFGSNDISYVNSKAREHRLSQEYHARQQQIVDAYRRERFSPYDPMFHRIINLSEQERRQLV